MGIDSINLATIYTPTSKHLKVAVSILDDCKRPVHRGLVEVIFVCPDGSKCSMATRTDEKGIALFDVRNVDRGRWEVLVFNVSHPNYDLSYNMSSKRWHIDYI